MSDSSDRIHCGERVLTIAVAGELSAQRIAKVIHAHYPSLRDQSILWDLSEADLGPFGDDDFAMIAQLAARLLPRSERRKTAYIVRDKATYTKVWRYLNAAVAARVHAEYAVFMDAKSALAWLEMP